MITLILATVLSTASAADCPLDRPVQVGVHLSEPLVMKNKDGSLHGFDIDLVTDIANEAGCEVEFVETEFSNVLAGVEDGTFDLGAGAITMTADRYDRMEFTLPYMESGLGILSHSKDLSWGAYIWLLLTSSVFPVVCGYLLFLVIDAHLIWGTERLFRKPEDDGPGTIAKEYFDGIEDAFYFAHVCATTMGFGDIVAKSVPGRVVVMLSSVVGITFAGVLLGEIGSFTLNYDEAAPSSIEVLEDRPVAVKAGTTGERAARLAGAEVKTTTTLAEALALFEAGEVEAVVSDYPVLNYYAYSTGTGIANRDAASVEMYGYALPVQSTLRRSFDEALLIVLEDGRYEDTYQKWFSE